MIPRLFNANSTSFNTQGAALSDAASCEVIEIRNDAYTLTLTYPINGRNYDLIELRKIIVAKPNPTDDPQPFRIVDISVPSNGIVTISANHICYDISGYVCEPFTAGSAAAAMQSLSDYSVPANPFSFSTDIATAADMVVQFPTSCRALMGGVAGSCIDTYGGEWEYDKLACYLRSARGQNRGVSIKYGKNLSTLKQDKNCNSVYTAVYPFWKNDEGELVTLTEKTVACPGTYDYTRVLTLDMSDKFQSIPTENELRNAASAYIAENDVGIPTVSLDVSFVQLEQTTDFSGMALLERVSLCDTVTVEFPSMGVNATAKVIKTVYNALLERYASVEIGSYRPNIANTIASVSKRVKTLETTPPSPYREAVDRATQLITGNLGGYVLLHDSNGDGEPDEILIMDTDNILTALNVWRWNKNGLGYSSTGYNGTYGTAITADGHIVADYMDTGTLTANVIKSGIIRALVGNSYWDIESGDMHIENADLVLSGLKVFDHTQYTNADATRATNISAGLVEPTDADFVKLDINGDGKILANDASLILRMIEQGKDQKYHWKLYLNPSNRDKAIRITQAQQLGDGTISAEEEIIVIGTHGVKGGTYKGDVDGNVTAQSLDVRGATTGTENGLLLAGRAFNGGKEGFIAQGVTLSFDVENPSGWLVCVSTSTGTRHGLWYVYTTAHSSGTVYADALVTAPTGVELSLGSLSFSLKNSAQYSLQYQVSRLY